ncbi:unnamed protein product, partial [Amoebophrya sp. A25]
YHCHLLCYHLRLALAARLVRRLLLLLVGLLEDLLWSMSIGQWSICGSGNRIWMKGSSPKVSMANSKLFTRRRSLGRPGLDGTPMIFETRFFFA